MIKRIILLLLLLSLFSSKPNLFLGAGSIGFGCGSNSPAVQRPFSYLRIGPDTTPIIKKQYFQPHHFGGYSTMDHGIRAISHMHLVGAGVIDLGILGILPIKKQKIQIPSDPSVIFYKTTQFAQPGYYKVTLQNDIQIQLTSTQRVGIHRYKFPKISQKQSQRQSQKQSKQLKYHQILIMPSYLLQKKSKRNSSTIKCNNNNNNLTNNNFNNCLQGDISIYDGFSGRFGGLKLYYYIQWKCIKKINQQQQQQKYQQQEQLYLFDDKQINNNKNQVYGNYSGAIIKTNCQQIQIYVGISYVSKKNAKENYQKEIYSRNFDQIKIQSKQIWNQQLSRFQITAISQQHQIKIDTAIYRTLLSPTIFNDFNGQYPSFSLTGEIKKKPDDMKGIYTDMSLWDVHRTQFPWLLFQDFQRFNDIAKSIILINRQGSYMPKWPFANGHTGCMIGAHANTVLSDWILKTIKTPQSISQINIKQIFSFMLRNANTQTIYDSRSSIKQYINKGYLNVDENSGRSACSETLEYSYNDYGIMKVAEVLNDMQNVKEFTRRSKFYKNVFNNETKFFQPRYKNGSFVKISKQERINIFSNHYVQGNAWHYRFYAPHDVQGLIQLFGGKSLFIKQLDKFFRLSFFWPTTWLPNPYYWSGNQHDLFSVWLFNFADRSDLTQKYSRKIIDNNYGINGDGLPGNDDYGTMSAWLIFASLGFYPLPTENFYVLGSPVVHSARIYRKMGGGVVLPFNVNVKNNSVDNYKIDKVNINGKTIQNFVQYEDLNKKNVILSFQFKK